MRFAPPGRGRFLENPAKTAVVSGIGNPLFRDKCYLHSANVGFGAEAGGAGCPFCSCFLRGKVQWMSRHIATLFRW